MTTEGDHIGTSGLPEVTLTPVGEATGPSAPRLFDNSIVAGFLVLSLGLWAIPLLAYAHSNSGQPGNAELPGDVGSLVALLMAFGVLLLVVPAGLALLMRMRFARGYGIGIGICSASFAVLATLGGFGGLGPAAVLALVHTFGAGVGIVALLARRVGSDLRDVGTAAASLERSVNAATRPSARRLVWGLLAVAMGLEVVGAVTDGPVTLSTIGVPRTVHAWVLHLIALSVAMLAIFVMRKNKA